MKVTRFSQRVARIVAVLALAMAPEAAVAQSSTLYPYVAWNFAPYFVQETNLDDGATLYADQILPVDFDGDLYTANNADDVLAGQIVNGAPTIYYSLVETGPSDDGWYFLGYYHYHPRDLGPDGIPTYAVYNHDNDLEGVIIGVRKDGIHPYGVFQVVFSQAHGALIPSPNPTLPGSVQAIGGPFLGAASFWKDQRLGSYGNGGTYNRFVAIIRAHGHGTYAAQDCSDPLTAGDGGFGVDIPAAYNDNVFIVCVHYNHSAIVYWPESSDIPARALDPQLHTGDAPYHLVELTSSPIWLYRATNGAILEGNLLDLGFGSSGLERFPSSTSSHASPPWAWQGGQGECQFNNYCWYWFSQDGTPQGTQPIDWPPTSVGQYLTDPATAFATRVAGLEALGDPTVYNPYRYAGVSSPPALVASLSGADSIQINTDEQYTGASSGGVFPHTHRWYSNDSLVSTQIVSSTAGRSTWVASPSDYSPIVLRLDVQDANGSLVSSTKVATVYAVPTTCKRGCPVSPSP